MIKDLIIASTMQYAVIGSSTHHSLIIRLTSGVTLDQVQDLVKALNYSLTRLQMDYIRRMLGKESKIVRLDVQGGNDYGGLESQKDFSKALDFYLLDFYKSYNYNILIQPTVYIGLTLGDYYD